MPLIGCSKQFLERGQAGSIALLAQESVTPGDLGCIPPAAGPLVTRSRAIPALSHAPTLIYL